MNIYKYFIKPEELNGYSRRYELSPELAYQWASSNIDSEIPKNILNTIAKSPLIAYNWANITGKPFPEGEAAIAKNTRTSFSYAKNVLNDEFLKGEEVLADDITHALYYAINIKKSRFKKIEPQVVDISKKEPNPFDDHDSDDQYQYHLALKYIEKFLK